MMKVIINSPRLDNSVSGITAVCRFIIHNNKDVEYIHCPIGRPTNERGSLMRFIRLIKSLRDWEIILKNNPDALIHYNYPLSFASIFRDSIFLMLRGHHDYILHIHGGAYLFKEKIPYILKSILRLIFKQASAIVTLSDLEKQKIENDYGVENVFVLPNCPEINFGEHLYLQKSESAVTIGYLGRIVREKGMSELLDAVSTMISSGCDLKVSIAGDDPDNSFIPKFKNRLGTCFTYYGIISGEEKAKFLNSLDIFILPSYFEGLPMSLLESMSYGAVPVVTKVGSIPTVIKDNENGFFIEIKSSESIVERVKYLISNRTVMENMKLMAKKTIAQKFNAEEYCHKLNDIYAIKLLNL